MPSERLGLRAWLEENLTNRRYHGVKWVDETRGTFSISWKHASRHGWIADEDAAIFKDWAIHTGRFCESRDEPNPKTWKANFRCAMNASRDIKKVKNHCSLLKGKNACRVFEFSKNRKSRVIVSQRNTRLEKKEEMETRAENNGEPRRCNLRLATRRHKYVSVKCETKEDDKSLRNENVSCETKQSVCLPTDCLQSVDTQNTTQIHSLPFKQEYIKDYNKGDRYIPNIYDTKYFSFSELLERIPRDISVISPFTFSNSSNVISDTSDSVDEDIKDLLKYVDSDIYMANVSKLENLDENSAYQSYCSTPDTSDAEDIAEIFDDVFDYRNHSSTFKELENILRPKENGDYEKGIFFSNCEVPPLSSINAPFFPSTYSPVVSDPFLGQDYQKNDMIAAMTTSFVY